MGSELLRPCPARTVTSTVVACRSLNVLHNRRPPRFYGLLFCPITLLLRFEPSLSFTRHTQQYRRHHPLRQYYFQSLGLLHHVRCCQFCQWRLSYAVHSALTQQNPAGAYCPFLLYVEPGRPRSPGLSSPLVTGGCLERSDRTCPSWRLPGTNEGVYSGITAWSMSNKSCQCVLPR